MYAIPTAFARRWPNTRAKVYLTASPTCERVLDRLTTSGRTWTYVHGRVFTLVKVAPR